MDVLSLIPQFGNLLFTIIAFVIALSVIVAVHEYGHYIVGRWSGIHAEVFSIGFGPVLWSRVDKRGTRWQIAALPFGGYVKFLGDANAASGKDEAAMTEIVEQSPEDLRRTMHGAPLWARSATVAAGPVFNFVMSILVFGMIFLTQGEIKEPLTVGTLHPLPGTVQELQDGDEIIAIAGFPTPESEVDGAWDDFIEALPVEPVLDYTVIRDGQTLDVSAPWLFPPLIQSVAPRSAAMDIDLKKGDVITSVNGDPIFAFDQLKEHVEGSDGKVLLLNVWRDGADLEFALAPRRTDEPQPEGGFVTHWRIGIVGGMMIEPAKEAAGVWDSLAGGARQTVRIAEGSLSGIWHMITGAISTCNMSGPIGIAETSGAMASQGAQSFIFFIAVLSTAVGLLNLFPIPALDGGHLVFYAYEAVTGKPPSDGALKVLMGVGISLILGLMIFSVSNDLLC
ncbi:RIP metalloprotease RseP [Ruegeria arenilitoris]|uniref:RIP metalloprotease RseP n=1 Tax=Ruegeria arenilitoris TaxID=1173585 RepID=UPI00147E5C62|nr:RIP metalloprotease RseP [Ruegeria arenilitoris]